MAPDLQFLQNMRSLLTLITLSAFTGSLAFAEPICVGAYRQVHADYFTKLEQLQTQQSEAKVGGYVIGGLMVACLIGIKSVKLCAGLLGIPLGTSVAYAKTRLGQIQRLEDGYKIYELYYDINRGNLSAELVRELFRSTNTTATQEPFVARELVRMIESGEMCNGGPAPTMSWDGMIAALTQGNQAKN